MTAADSHPEDAHSLPSQLLTLVAVQEIQRVMARYSQFVSARRYGEWAGLFAADGQFTGPEGVRAEGTEGLEKYIRASHAGWVMKQITTNSLIDVDLGKGTATASSDWFVFRVDGGQNRVAAVGRYEDEYVLTAGRWRIQRRHAVTLKDGVVGGATVPDAG
ncbi:nuclear transport factor 2 family protein [Rhodococcus sp. BP-349]|uniref:nuclear transport factor 2 family protein n=1 Tax=unclassified Rhodococcus (in: high G+C Gram-positive bacteria) TaxID=192944 RepID=UPI001C9AE6E3|nr:MULTISPECIES: nuclear transport factor 2 family protein [unclassified Rhodococcus (in: high G+C Gram-positive bacteria)]MBY6537815.1 nuclear transport factor 2 family protein [Rhodococcus sp. BP-363]MBY6542152.1 nuclear transport factor 2 family protein [Rhodococcus sp. BP-369]MBY6561382.1 nuclear transport factor 2 family protein [Rhodococcus sp. BP-370]MBY6575674.1 nuclear transport factor 2 family protein [Rhodococcus sp. BP-364]MBY6584975.1 nuclear transport factor 2 family protein [Rho